jgi:hypothetical protein
LLVAIANRTIGITNAAAAAARSNIANPASTFEEFRP